MRLVFDPVNFFANHKQGSSLTCTRSALSACPLDGPLQLSRTCSVLDLHYLFPGRQSYVASATNSKEQRNKHLCLATSSMQFGSTSRLPADGLIILPSLERVQASSPYFWGYDNATGLGSAESADQGTRPSLASRSRRLSRIRSASGEHSHYASGPLPRPPMPC